MPQSAYTQLLPNSLLIFTLPPPADPLFSSWPQAQLDAVLAAEKEPKKVRAGH